MAHRLLFSLLPYDQVIHSRALGSDTAGVHVQLDARAVRQALHELAVPDVAGFGRVGQPHVELRDPSAAGVLHALPLVTAVLQLASNVPDVAEVVVRETIG
jgi:hypothetical protein